VIHITILLDTTLCLVTGIYHINHSIDVILYSGNDDTREIHRKDQLLSMLVVGHFPHLVDKLVLRSSVHGRYGR
jgi:hypothetical protein